MLMANLIGQQAADLQMVDSNGVNKSLYNVKAHYVVVCFWDPTCGHCRTRVPRLDSLYNAKWKMENQRRETRRVGNKQDECSLLPRWLQSNGEEVESGVEALFEAGEGGSIFGFGRIFDDGPVVKNVQHFDGAAHFLKFFGSDSVAIEEGLFFVDAQIVE